MLYRIASLGIMLSALEQLLLLTALFALEQVYNAHKANRLLNLRWHFVGTLLNLFPGFASDSVRPQNLKLTIALRQAFLSLPYERNVEDSCENNACSIVAC